MLSFDSYGDPIGSDPRRSDPRIDALTLCSEMHGGELRHGFVVDLSERGVRIERPFFGGPLAGRIQLELEVPEIDEVIWAAAAPCYDVRSRRPSVRPGELGGLVRTSGFRLVNAAGRTFRMLRDVVFETRRRQLTESLLHASCYTRG